MFRCIISRLINVPITIHVPYYLQKRSTPLQAHTKVCKSSALLASASELAPGLLGSYVLSHVSVMLLLLFPLELDYSA